MSKEIVQHAVIRVVQLQIVRYTCDFCKKVCGTRDNPKSTRYSAGGGESHFCKKTCDPLVRTGNNAGARGNRGTEGQKSWYER